LLLWLLTRSRTPEAGGGTGGGGESSST